MSASKARRIGVFGASGSGKSSYVKRLIKTEPRVVILDPMDEYGAEGATRCTTVAEVQQIMAASFKKFRIAFVPPSGLEAVSLNRLSHLCLKAQEPFLGKASAPLLNLVVEEMNTCFPVHGGDTKVRAFAEVCSRGRHRFVQAIGVSQRLAEVSTRFRGNLEECVIFRQQGRNDVTAAIDATGATKAQVTGLRNLHYLRSIQGEITEGEIKF